MTTARPTQPGLVFQLIKRSMRARRLLNDLVFWADTVIMGGYNKEAQVVALIKRLKREQDLFVSAHEAFMIHSLARAQRYSPGDFAEVGVYRGGSAQLIAAARTGPHPAPLHLFDTFAGLPALHPADGNFFQAGMFSATLAHAQAALQGQPNIQFHVGLFPQTAEAVRDRVFTFVHLDVDLYESMKAGLEFFYPRLGPRGALLAHDYTYPGVQRAFDEFLAQTPARLIELTYSQCLLLK
jgi:hypothetical protein